MRVGLGEPHPACREIIDGRRVDIVRSVAAGVERPLIIGEKNDNVGAICGLARIRRNEGAEGEEKKAGKHVIGVDMGGVLGGIGEGSSLSFARPGG